MSSTFKWATNTLIVGAVASIFITFFASRAIIFNEAYKNAASRKEADRYMREVCDTHTRIAQYEPEMCAKALLATQRSPWSFAAAETIAQTHSCGQWPCSTLYGLVLEKTSSTLFNIILALGLLLFVYVIAVRFIGSAMHTAQAKHYMDSQAMLMSAPSRIEGGADALRYHTTPPYIQYANEQHENSQDGIRLLGLSSRRAHPLEESD